MQGTLSRTHSRSCRALCCCSLHDLVALRRELSKNKQVYPPRHRMHHRPQFCLATQSQESRTSYKLFGQVKGKYPRGPKPQICCGCGCCSIQDHQRSSMPPSSASLSNEYLSCNASNHNIERTQDFDRDPRNHEQGFGGNERQELKAF